MWSSRKKMRMKGPEREEVEEGEVGPFLDSVSWYILSNYSNLTLCLTGFGIALVTHFHLSIRNISIDFDTFFSKLVYCHIATLVWQLHSLSSSSPPGDEGRRTTGGREKVDEGDFSRWMVHLFGFYFSQWWLPLENLFSTLTTVIILSSRSHTELSFFLAEFVSFFWKLLT